ncbi:MAG TPA: ATP-binding cassette domain-containing protein [Lachnospiraceae bacterium]|nr:ATP-binding cassette domain-containing protein [Lachnospiraceae bacterium]
MDHTVILTMRHIDKSFPGVVALSNVDFTLRSGEIHALMGENGAGKSTLIKVLTGVEEFESGAIHIEGKTVTFISSEVEEMLRTCSKMVVLRDSQTVGEINESELNQINIMKAIAGGDDNE